MSMLLVLLVVIPRLELPSIQGGRARDGMYPGLLLPMGRGQQYIHEILPVMAVVTLPIVITAQCAHKSLSRTHTLGSGTKPEFITSAALAGFACSTTSLSCRV